MSKVVFVEIIDRAGRVKDRHRLSSFPVSLGRDYSNDVVIEDRYVCGRHVSIENGENATLLIKDLESVNGIRTLPSQEQVGEAEIHCDSRFQIGHTILRFRTEEFEVLPTLVDTDLARNWARSLTKLSTALLSLVLLAAFTALLTYLDTYDHVSLRKYTSLGLKSFVGFVVAFILWSGVWSFASRIVLHRFYFVTHFTIITLCYVIAACLGVFKEYLLFVLPNDGFDLTLKIVGYFIFLALPLFGHLGFSTHKTVKQRLRISGLISFGLVGLMGTFSYLESQEYTTRLDFQGSLKPPAYHILPGVSVDEFFAEVDTMKEKLVEQAAGDDE